MTCQCAYVLYLRGRAEDQEGEDGAEAVRVVHQHLGHAAGQQPGLGVREAGVALQVGLLQLHVLAGAARGGAGGRGRHLSAVPPLAQQALQEPGAAADGAELCEGEIADRALVACGWRVEWGIFIVDGCKRAWDSPDSPNTSTHLTLEVHALIQKLRLALSQDIAA